MKWRRLGFILFFLLFLIGFQSCTNLFPPSVPVPLGPTITPGLTPSKTPTSTLVSTPTNSPLVNTPTNTLTNTLTPSPSNTPTNSPTSTLTNTPTGTPTGGWLTPTPTPSNTPTRTPTNTSTYTPVYTSTPCTTFTFTLTACMPPTPAYHISGSVIYSGTGSVNFANSIVVGFYNGGQLSGTQIIGTSNGTYTVGSIYPSSGNLVAFYNFNGLVNYVDANYQTYYVPVPGERYTNGGPCGNPAVPISYSVTFSGAAGTTTVGPTITLNDTCSYWGIYGNVNYTGSKGAVQYCRRIYINSFSDSGYSAALTPGGGTLKNNSPYYILTNSGTSTTGLSPLYLQAWYDANGDYAFDTGDPYLNLGQNTPTTDGLLLNINFGDTTIK